MWGLARGRVKMDKVEDTWTRRGHSDGVVGQAGSKGTVHPVRRAVCESERLGCVSGTKREREGLSMYPRPHPIVGPPDCPSIPPGPVSIFVRFLQRRPPRAGSCAESP